jgi:lysophospholipase L1-like esterase
VVFALVPLAALLVLVEAAAAVIAGSELSRRPVVAWHGPSPLPPDALERGVDGGGHAERTIACAGDSWTFGQGLSAGDAWPVLLGQRLATDHGMASRVVNLGRPGASGSDVASALAWYFANARADLVVYLAGVNPSPPAAIPQGERHPPVGGWSRALLQRLASYRLLEQVVARARLGAAEWGFDPAAYSPKGGPLSDLGYRREDVKANLAMVDDLATAHAARVLVLVYGLPDEVAARQWGRAALVGALNQVIREAAPAQGLPLLDLQATYRSRGVGREVLLHPETLDGPDGWLDLHPNRAGYEIYAEEIARWVAGEP